MSQAVHWAKDRNTWLMVIGAVLVLGGVIGASEGIHSATSGIFVGGYFCYMVANQKSNVPEVDSVGGRGHHGVRGGLLSVLIDPVFRRSVQPEPSLSFESSGRRSASS